ncbi:MAG: M23 family metallopeptidase [Bacteroidetes bacterium]|nr:M23 family metallopeptidase [Bacteroidota bacterium]
MKYLFALLIFYTPVFAQNYPQDYFRPPLDLPMQLAGNFGELRSNHFHTGFDFKTQQKEGFPVFASADGYVSRIKISPFGYGKAIYIDHPNGYTTVYGHLQKGYGKLEQAIRAEQYKAESFEVEIFPAPGELPVKKGDTIAFSGNTGGSEGPHLHFEFRDTKSEKIINPLYFGFDKFLPDTKKPLISGLMIYPIGEGSIANESQKPVMVNLSLQKDGNYIAEKIYAQGRIGFGLICGDYDNVSYNNNGVFKVEAFNNGSPSFEYEFSQLSFDEGRYVNALIDFQRFRNTKQRYQKLFAQNPYGLSIIKTDAQNGILEVQSEYSQVFKIQVSDFNQNQVTVFVPIDYAQQSVLIKDNPEKTAYFLQANTDNIYEKDGMEVFFPAKTFYDDFYLKFSVQNKVMNVHDDSVPVHSNFKVSITDSTVVNKDKTFVASLSGTRKIYNPTKRKDDTYTAYTKNLGGFTLATDTIAPKIALLHAKSLKKMDDQKQISLKIGDDLSGIKSYKGYINEKWVLFEYDNKSDRITYEINDDEVIEGENQLKVIVSDNLGNSAIFETTFFRNKKTK